MKWDPSHQNVLNVPTPTSGTLVSFMFKNYHPSAWTFISKWSDLTRSNLGTFSLPKLNFLKTDLDNQDLRSTKLNEFSILVGILKLPDLIRNLKSPLQNTIY